MPNFESKTVKTNPNSEDKIVEIYENFGWTLEDSQEVYNKHTDTGDTIVIGDVGFTQKTTETTHFVRLRFRRDKDIPNYSKIKELETEFWDNFNVFAAVPSAIPGKLILFWAGIMIIPTLCMLLFGGFSEFGIAEFFGVAIIFILGLTPIVLRTVLYYLPKKKQGDECILRCEQIEEEVKKIR